jgi:hypothetical protein
MTKEEKRQYERKIQDIWNTIKKPNLQIMVREGEVQAKGIEMAICVQEAFKARCRWLIPVILATREAEFRRITIRSQPR